jgi:hypothetical protein
MTFWPGQWHENERLLTLVQGVPGRLVLWAAATALLLLHGAGAVPLAAFAAVMLDPQRKRLWLSVAAFGALGGRFLDLPESPLYLLPAAPWLPAVLIAAAATAALFLAWLLARGFARWPAACRRHPVLTVHAAIWTGLALSGLPWLGLLALAPYFAWRLSYLAVSAGRGRLAGTGFRDHLFYLVPAWGGTVTPYGKGLDFLSRHEAGDALALARSRLAGVKLLLLAVAWVCALGIMNIVVYGRAPELPGGQFARMAAEWLAGFALGWPGVSDVVRSGVHPPWYLGWATIYLELIRATLALAATGHVIVGSLRLFGFNVFRNTYKPLLAESVLEFWNRYYYYFKELLVDFFFYPAYLRLRGLSPSLRMLAAVFAAAFLGNMYHHLLAQPEHVVRLDLPRLWADWSPRLLYCFLLALGIWVSMLRQQRLRAAGSAAGAAMRLRRIAGVWTFYSLIHIWNLQGDGIDLAACAKFFLSLFGI